MITFVPHRSTPTSTSLIRFVTDGLLATIESYQAGNLPLHRFAWELHTRIDTLAGLDPPSRTVTRLRWLQRTVELLHAELTSRADAGGHAGHPAGHTELTADEQNFLTVTLRDMTLVLATLTPPSPLDPAGAARPMSIEPAAIAHVRPATAPRLVA
jgi:hypothetical protein